MTELGKISFWTAVLMSINIIVGGGIFAGPKSMTAIAGTLSFSAWFLAAILVFPIVWGVSRAAVVFPGSGGFYNYCKTGINPDFGFLAHWFYLLGYIMGTASAMTFLLREGLANRLGISFAAEHPYITHALILVVFSLLNLMPIGIVSRIQAGATLLKLAPLIIVTVLTGFYFNSTLEYNWAHIDTLPATIPTVIFGYLGFEACCSLSHLLKDGPSSVGKVVLTAFFITAILYMIFHFGLLQIMGPEQLAAEGAIAFPSSLGWSSGPAMILGVIIGGAILLSYANSLFGLSLGNITNIIAISKGSKTQAALIHGVAIWLLLCFMSDINNIFAFTVVGVGAAYFLTTVAVFRHSLKTGETFQAIIMALGFVSCSVMFYCCWIGLGGGALDRILNISPILIGVVVGFVLYRMGSLKIS
ncbi:MAG: APC family permease [Myxococcaceae bacterium]